MRVICKYMQYFRSSILGEDLIQRKSDIVTVNTYLLKYITCFPFVFIVEDDKYELIKIMYYK